MGRITIFTGDDLHSERVRQALRRRCIPFTEISVARFPSKKGVVASLSKSEALPQVFFNCHHIGGPVEIFEELQKWDCDPDFDSPLQKYETFIVPAGNDTIISKLDPGVGAPYEVPKYEVPEKITRMIIKLPDGTSTSVVDMTEKLKASLPREDVRIGKTIYKNVFSGSSAIAIFKESMDIGDNHAEVFAQYLLNKGIIQACPPPPDRLGVGTKNLSTKERFHPKSGYYRLQALSTPHILNSYRRWNDDLSNSDPNKIVRALTKLLFDIEVDSLTEEGKIDCENCVVHSKFPEFEDAICELQVVELAKLSELKALAFAINVYKLMLQYAFLKVGVCTDENARLSLLHRVCFCIGGYNYSFREWVDGILRGNQPATYASRPAFKSIDERCMFSFSKLDYKIHFALNLDPRLGSSSCPLFFTYSASRIKEQLRDAARLYCGDDNHVKVDNWDNNNNGIILSRVFAWYKSDFNDGEVAQVICNYLGNTEKLGAFKSQMDMKRMHIKYSDPDWSSLYINYVPFEKSNVRGEIKYVEKAIRRMIAPKSANNESLRLATLHSLNLLDTLPDERFDRLTKMVKDELNVPVVYISLVDEQRQWIKSKQWFCSAPEMANESDRSSSFCGHVVLLPSDEVMVIEDALKDDRFAENPWVTGPEAFIRFYASCNLAVPTPGSSDNIVNIGTLCAVDQKPRKFGRRECDILRRYAIRIRNEILEQEI